MHDSQLPSNVSLAAYVGKYGTPDKHRYWNHNQWCEQKKAATIQFIRIRCSLVRVEEPDGDRD